MIKDIQKNGSAIAISAFIMAMSSNLYGNSTVGIPNVQNIIHKADNTVPGLIQLNKKKLVISNSSSSYINSREGDDMLQITRCNKSISGKVVTAYRTNNFLQPPNYEELSNEQIFITTSRKKVKIKGVVKSVRRTNNRLI